MDSFNLNQSLHIPKSRYATTSQSALSYQDNLTNYVFRGWFPNGWKNRATIVVGIEKKKPFFCSEPQQIFFRVESAIKRIKFQWVTQIATPDRVRTFARLKIVRKFDLSNKCEWLWISWAVATSYCHYFKVYSGRDRGTYIFVYLIYRLLFLYHSTTMPP